MHSCNHHIAREWRQETTVPSHFPEILKSKNVNQNQAVSAKANASNEGLTSFWNLSAYITAWNTLLHLHY